MTKICALIIIFFQLFLSAAHCEEQWTGLQIMKEQENRHKSQTEFTKEIMILTDKNGAKEKRVFRRYVKENFKDNTSGLLIVFDSPKSISGTAMLTWDNKDRDNDQWLYLPARGMLQRITAGSKKGYFMGTDFTYEDMEPENIDN
ncbi:MAG: outer membrane lipoprotein-sorting protein, partial [Spirochaetales bacterium]|nr:outer membrane lipoprotein-sorting protein [Spirochaetales bacterium]